MFERRLDDRHAVDVSLQDQRPRGKSFVPRCADLRPIGAGLRPVVIRRLEIETVDAAVVIEPIFPDQGPRTSVAARDLGVVLLVRPAAR